MSHAYPKELLLNTQLHKEAENLHKGGFINKSQLQNILTGKPGLHTQPNVFIRGGLFLFACIIMSSLYGFFVLLIDIHSEGFFKMMLLVTAGLAFFSLEYLVKEKHYYGFGIDHALLFMGIVLALLFVSFLFDFNTVRPACIIAIALGSFCCYRYIDNFAAGVACAGFVGLIADICIQSGVIGQSVLPFALMAGAGIIYFTYRRLKRVERTNNIWGDCLNLVYLISLVLFYISGNYMAVRTGREELMGAPVAEDSDIPLAWLFYLFTILVPIAYIYIGLKNKERLTLQIGILALAFGVYSIHYYHQILPVEWGLILAGSLVFAIAYYCINLLKHNKQGITFKPDRFTSQTDALNVEAMIVAEGLKLQPVKQHDPLEGGDGQFGGGGAGDGY